MSRVLITGGAGFIGSRLAVSLHERGDEVIVLDTLSEQVHGPDPETTSATYPVAAKVATVIRGSVTERADVMRALDGVDVVVHFAAETGTGQSMYEIERYVDANIRGTAVLLEAIAESDHRVRRVVVASSRSVYGEGAYEDATGAVRYPEHRPDEQLSRGVFDVVGEDGEPLTCIATDEDSVLHPSSIYGITKQVQEQLVLTAARSQGIEAVSLRFQNVYGPGQSLTNPYTGILSIFTSLLLAGRQINVFEDGEESRDFVFIDDVVAATVAAIDSDSADGQAINVGSGVPTTVLRVLQLLGAAYSVDPDHHVSGDYRLGDIRHNYADLRKAERLLGFAPQLSVEEGIRRFAEWARDEQTDADAYKGSLGELQDRGLLRSVNS
ncbi:NAD-dependent epimerase/dehydratase family protein [Microbacterium foliorum]|uniref:NAD-dependent epimerase/dehydratase family protein n=1 Tax=Microbacterium foliorum TaxID=104336 RepID=UPI001D737F41|nr:NAD-dependent epimerase/dehydratase family protein [Microbacterium foliorum]CAH0146365.1 dTDP-L-rhamnose 4-epimerase [Microbacterium foliorum]CAH0147810.1 dTDP-L-rhamnose 4-epimerase [Microbacterium foliorum]